MHFLVERVLFGTTAVVRLRQGQSLHGFGWLT